MLRTLSFLGRAVTLGPYYSFIVHRAVRDVLDHLPKEHPEITEWLHYGATYLDPKHLVIWYLVATTAQLTTARTGGIEDILRKATRAALEASGYPPLAVPHVHIGLESQENLDQAGGWYHYFH